MTYKTINKNNISQDFTNKLVREPQRAPLVQEVFHIRGHGTSYPQHPSPVAKDKQLTRIRHRRAPRRQTMYFKHTTPNLKVVTVHSSWDILPNIAEGLCRLPYHALNCQQTVVWSPPQGINRDIAPLQSAQRVVST